MELSNIEKLLEKYFEGETTLSEEKELKVFFTRESVPQHLEKYKSLFQFFSDERNITAGSDTYIKVSNKVSKFTWIGIAASIAVIIGLFFAQPPTTDTDLGTYEDPEVALQKTKEVLSLVAQYMNEGKKDLVYLNEFENTKNKFLK
ncbi:hypothetical protein GCM10022393_33480 [Aquimarina addita]|uniref:Uncharacterized protein n=1 Tax=Aquimarina addita TaxID=870485 RepID=A0ABP6UQ11_9FLAO